MNRLGKFFEGYINPLLSWIREDNIGPALAALIVICGLLILFYGLAITIYEGALLRKAAAIIGKKSEEEFAKDFNSIDQDLQKIKKVDFAWSEFSESLIRPRISADGVVERPCENTVRPHSYFNLYDMSIGPDFIRVFPSVFVGVGLSLTFLGLISALQTAVEAINSSAGNTESIQAAIGDLLKISSAKFYASLFALFMSVNLTVAIRAFSWYLEREVGKLTNKIESGVRFLTQEQLALRSIDVASEQLIQLQTFNTDLAMKIGEQIETSLNETLGPVFQKIGSMSSDITDQNIAAIKTISEEVSKGIEGATGQSMDRVANKLDAVSEKLGGLSEALTNALSGFDADFAAMLESLKETLTASTQTIASDISSSMDKVKGEVSASASEMSGLIGKLSASIQSMANAGAEVSERTGEELRKQVEAASRQAADQLAEAGRSLSEGFRESTTDFVDSLNGASVSLSALNEGLGGLPPKLDEVNSKLITSSESIGQAAVRFSSATSGLEGVIRPLAEYARSSNEAITSITELLGKTAENLGAAAESIKDSVSKLQDEVSAQIRQLDGADEQLAKLLGSIEQSSLRVITSINTFVAEVDDSFSSSVGLLKEAISDFEEVVDTVSQIKPPVG